jgi:hypothetical protein
MTHPLTEEIIEKIAANIRHYDYSVPIIFKCDMRAAADWQLEQVIKYIQAAEWFADPERRISQLLAAMRPQEN